MIGLFVVEEYRDQKFTLGVIEVR